MSSTGTNPSKTFSQAATGLQERQRQRRTRQFTSITSKADPFAVVRDPRHDWDDLPF